MMNPFSKLFAASATSLEDKLFLWAKIKLSVLYTLFVVVILTVLSGLLYYELVLNITDSFGDQLSVGSPQEHALRETLERLRVSIVLTDIVIIFIVAVLSYFFARYTLRPIRKSLDTQKRFVADASHELRTPLTVMKTELEVTLRNVPTKPEDIRSVFDSTLEEVERMSLLTDQLLFLSRIDAPSYAAFTYVNLSELVKRVVSKMKTIAHAKDLALASSIHPDIQIVGHMHDLERLLYNLLQNAVVYTKDGSIDVQLKQSGSDVLLIIQDTGIGIAPTHLPYIFERFYKVDAARDALNGGAGLGLAITKEIVERHHGHIAIESNVGKGTMFTIRFKAT
jgi:signal transduction histidine kinase